MLLGFEVVVQQLQLIRVEGRRGGRNGRHGRCLSAALNVGGSTMGFEVLQGLISGVAWGRDKEGQNGHGLCEEPSQRGTKAGMSWVWGFVWRRRGRGESLWREY